MSDQPRKKLIEVALPLDEINAACKADKGRAHGTIKNIHKWFAPMPLPAWRALLFAALVDDPGDEERRAALLDVIKRLVASGADVPSAPVVREARKILADAYPRGLPLVFDPFCGGGSTLVEGQRLGLPTLGSDLNPVPALVSRTLSELLPKTHGRQPVHGETRRSSGKASASTADSESMFSSAATARTYSGYDGLTVDVLHYAEVVKHRVKERLAEHFPPPELFETPIAWLWARTARCPNPTCGAETILTTTWWLSKKKHQMAWIQPVVAAGEVALTIETGRTEGNAPSSPKIGDGVFACLICAATLDAAYLRVEGKAGRLGLRMTAVIAERHGKRVYRVPRSRDTAHSNERPDDVDFTRVPINGGGQGIRVGLYGMTTWDQIYTPRQLRTLVAFADAVAEIHSEVLGDGGDLAWADAVTTVLGLGVGRLAQFSSTQTRWTVRENVVSFEGAFPRNDLPMTWDFYELNPFGETGPTWSQTFASTTRSFRNVVADGEGQVRLSDARVATPDRPALVATDPPYFDAIGYADLSDYFYVWHRRALRSVHPDLYTTLATPKVGELTAVPGHHGNSKTAARDYFTSGFTEAFANLQGALGPDLPMIVVYASKEQKGGADEEGRWSSILTAIVLAGLQITGTWPILGTTDRRMIGQGTNSVATYVVMVCRPRPATAGTSSLADFNRSLRRELKPAVHDFQAAGILPVDLGQAAMGPGMQVYSRYREVVDQAGKRVSAVQALQLINAALGEVLDEQEGELDPYSRFAVAWWERHGWSAAGFGMADQIARPQGISVDEAVRAGVARYPRPGFVELLGAGQMDRTWTPSADGRPSAWEAVHHLADRLIAGGGATEAARLMGQLGTFRDPARALVYRLHLIAARKNWTKDQERYNDLIGSWSDLLALSATEKDGLF